jgi:hypothetical protein
MGSSDTYLDRKEGGTKLMETKRYPFSLGKNHHNLQLLKNRLLNLMEETTDQVKLDEYQNRFDRIINILSKYHNGNWVVWLSGEELSFAKSVVNWSMEERGGI